MPLVNPPEVAPRCVESNRLSTLALHQGRVAVRDRPGGEKGKVPPLELEYHTGLFQQQVRRSAMIEFSEGPDAAYAPDQIARVPVPLVHNGLAYVQRKGREGKILKVFS